MPRSVNTGSGPASSKMSGAKTAGGSAPKKPTPGNRPNGSRPRPNAVVRARKAKRAGSWWWIVALACVVAIGIGAVALSGGGSGSSPSASPTGSTGPVLAAASASLTGKTIDGIQCLGSEQLKFHDHAHLSVFVDGKQRTVPAFIGIAPDGSCLYWLHSHTPDGVIHMESPIQRTFTLGNYFAIWGQPLSATQVGPAKGTITAFVDGKKVTGDPSTIKLGEHVNVQLDVGKVVPFKNYSYGSGL
jgi:hypothetical protein